MSLFWKTKKESGPAAMLREAFSLGEEPAQEDLRAAAVRYKSITRQYPDCYAAWYNLGVVQSRTGSRQEALESFFKAQESPEFKIAAAYARLKLRTEHSMPFCDEELRVLGLQGPCYNAANAFRNKGYVCTVEAKSEHSCKLTVMAGRIKYTIMLSDVFGTLIKNVFRGEKEKSVDLLEVKNKTKLDEEVLYLNICSLALAQSPVNF